MLQNKSKKNCIDFSEEDFGFLLDDLSRFKKSDYHTIRKMLKYFGSQDHSTDSLNYKNFKHDYTGMLENTLLSYFDKITDKEK